MCVMLPIVGLNRARVHAATLWHTCDNARISHMHEHHRGVKHVSHLLVSIDYYDTVHRVKDIHRHVVCFVVKATILAR